MIMNRPSKRKVVKPSKAICEVPNLFRCKSEGGRICYCPIRILLGWPRGKDSKLHNHGTAKKALKHISVLVVCCTVLSPMCFISYFVPSLNPITIQNERCSSIQFVCLQNVIIHVKIYRGRKKDNCNVYRKAFSTEKWQTKVQN